MIRRRATSRAAATARHPARRRRDAGRLSRRRQPLRGRRARRRQDRRLLDQAENHARVATYVPAGAKALDAFTYHGGFASALARGGAKSVLALDEAAPAVERAQRERARNSARAGTRGSGQRVRWLRALEGEGRSFDVVVIDPPALAKRKSAFGAADRAYKELNLRALRLARARRDRRHLQLLGQAVARGVRRHRRRGGARRGTDGAAPRAARRGARSSAASRRARNRVFEVLDLESADMSARGRFEALWDTLTSEQQTLLARDYATRARAEGAFVVLADARQVAIPPILTPSAIEPRACARCRCRRTTSPARSTSSPSISWRITARAAQAAALRRLHRARGRGARRHLAQVGAAGDGARRLSRRHRGPCACARGQQHDPGDAGLLRRHRRAFIPAVAAARARPDAFATRSSTTTGVTATISWHRCSRTTSGSAVAPAARSRIAIVARSGDAQYGELRHYVRRWEALGHARSSPRPRSCASRTVAPSSTASSPI